MTSSRMRRASWAASDAFDEAILLAEQACSAHERRAALAMIAHEADILPRAQRGSYEQRA